MITVTSDDRNGKQCFYVSRDGQVVGVYDVSQSDVDMQVGRESDGESDLSVTAVDDPSKLPSLDKRENWFAQ